MNLALLGGQLSASHPCHFIPRERDLLWALDNVEKRKLMILHRLELLTLQ
jgi:hypothetical protein